MLEERGWATQKGSRGGDGAAQNRAGRLRPCAPLLVPRGAPKGEYHPYSPLRLSKQRLRAAK